MRSRGRLLPLVVVAVVLAGCGGGSPETETVAEPAPTETTQDPPAAPEPDGDGSVEAAPSEQESPEPDTGGQSESAEAEPSPGPDPAVVVAAIADPPPGLDDCVRDGGGFSLADLGDEPDEFEISVVADCLQTSPSSSGGGPTAGESNDVTTAPSDSPFGGLGEPDNARECLATVLVGDADRGVEVEGDLLSGSVDTADGYQAWVECVGVPTLFDGSSFVEATDLGFPITFDTPGIIAMPMDDPGYFGRQRGIETLADPSAVLLSDGRVALYFSGDHRAAGQSTRWVTPAAVNPSNPDLEFIQESDYNLLTRTSWRNILFLGEGEWVGFGLENVTDGLTRWTSNDGLYFSGGSQVYSPSAYDADLDAVNRVVPSIEGVPNSAVTRTSLGFFAVFEHLREGFEVEGCPPACDLNGDGFESTAFIRVYRSSDGLSWTPGAVITGPSEGEVVELASGILMLVRPDGIAHFSRDGDEWGFGVDTGVSHVDVDLGGETWLGFGTQSNSTGGISAEISRFDLAAIDEDWFLPATVANFIALTS